MITGFNTDVKYRGVVYHVQTEDKGAGNPLIETLIYKGGEILSSRRLPHASLGSPREEPRPPPPPPAARPREVTAPPALTPRTVNGGGVDCPAGSSLAGLLSRLGLDRR